MHRDLLRHLRTATGTSHQVAAVFLDVRGFTSFAGVAESSDTAIFLRSFYTRTLDDYFPDAAFFKPTGDGLMIVIHLEDDAHALRTKMKEVLLRSIDLVNYFPTLCKGDVLVNFSVPEELGVGIARGSATRIGTPRKALDYTGRCLNLAARLMDLARPRGVVFNDLFAMEFLDNDLRRHFNQESVYLKGVAETEPTAVLFTHEWTTILPQHKRPLRVVTWKYEEEEQFSLKKFRDLGSVFLFPVTAVPSDTDQVKVTIGSHLPKNGRIDREHVTRWVYDADYVENSRGKFARLNTTVVGDNLIKLGVKLNWPVWVQVKYPQ